MLRIVYLVWVSLILSGGLACGAVVYKTWQLRHRARIFHYFGMVMTALFIATCNSLYVLIQMLIVRGFIIFDSLPFAAYRGLAIQTLLATTLWLFVLFSFGKVNGIK